MFDDILVHRVGLHHPSWDVVSIVSGTESSSSQWRVLTSPKTSNVRAMSETMDLLLVEQDVDFPIDTKKKSVSACIPVYSKSLGVRVNVLDEVFSLCCLVKLRGNAVHDCHRTGSPHPEVESTLEQESSKLLLWCDSFIYILSPCQEVVHIE